MQLSADRKLIIVVSIFTLFALGLQLPVIAHQQKIAQKEAQNAGEYSDFAQEYTSSDDEAESQSLMDDNDYTAMRDTQEQLYIIADELEFYYEENSTYPSVSNLKDLNWRKKNLPQLNSEIAKMIGNKITYVTVPANCTNTAQSLCKSFTLTAKSSDGEVFTEQSYN